MAPRADLWVCPDCEHVIGKKSPSHEPEECWVCGFDVHEENGNFWKAGDVD